MRIFSFGGGVQSMAVMVLQAQGRVSYDAFLFSNVGDDSENPATLDYYREVVKPYARDHGIELVELRRTISGKPVSLYEHIEGENRSIRIPVYMAGGAPGRRSCTTEWKREVVAKWLKEMGATEGEPAVVGLGISTDEIERVRTDSGYAWYTAEYPLIEMGMSRADCVKVIEGQYLPVPPKSSCWFCPFHKVGEWSEMRRERPELFERAVRLEERLNEKRAMLEKDRVYLHSSARPLDQAVGLQFAFEFDDTCESGFCMT